MIGFILLIIFQGFCAYLIGTIVFDFFHYFLHLAMKSKNPFFKTIGKIHLPHHQFYSISLKINHALTKKNLIQHILMEYFIHVVSILFCLFFLNAFAVFLALLFETAIFIRVCFWKGSDPHHREPNAPLSNCFKSVFVNADYHALHHIEPNKFFSSCIKVFDIIFGTGTQLKNKQIVMTGSNGALGSRMKILLQKAGAKVICFKYGEDYSYDNYDNFKNALETADILFLCHGTKYENTQQANCDSYIHLIELYKSVHKRSLIPPEIWGVGSEIECHPYFGIKKIKPYADSKRNFARKARVYFHEKDLLYRHIVHSAFISKMGPGLMTANFAAYVTLFLIKRGFKYIPVTYTGFAFINYLRFLLARSH